MNKKNFNIENKVYLCCNCKKKSCLNNDEYNKHLYDSSRFIECFFSIIIKIDDEKYWYVTVIWNSEHNHEVILAEIHSTIRKLMMMMKIYNEITHQIRIEMNFNQILIHLWLDINETQSLFKCMNIYNVKNSMRSQTLSALTLIQTLFQQLQLNEWFFWYKTNEFNKIIKLFFSKINCQKILKFNNEILIMNCIYKINWYKIFLLIINEIIILNIIFYVEFIFLIDKHMKDVIFLLL